MAQKYDEIAIVGVACHLPAGLKDRDSLWQFLLEQKDAVVEIPEDRWSIKRFYDPIDTTPGKTSMRYGSFLSSDAYDFEPLFFGISPREGMTMDYQQRLLLTVTWHVLEDAHLIPSDMLSSRTSVFIGGFTQDHMVYCGSPFMRGQIRDQFAATAAPMTMLAARLAHVFGFQGPTMSLDTACSSSLVALHQACNSLRLRECDMAIAGGVNFMALPQAAMIMTKGHFLAKDGRSKSFDAAADGYGRGEGCVLFALKRLDDALRDGNDIRGVICASGVNQDGRTAVLTMPDADAQENLIRDVAARADIPLSSIAYVEAHGTGTAVGDPIEAKAIGQAIGKSRAVEGKEGYKKVIVGAVKANLGHTEATAGALGVLKTLLCLEKGIVPPQANLTKLNPVIPFDDYHLEVPQGAPMSLKGREAADGHLYGLVNSFGYGGTNGVAILRRPTEQEVQNAQKIIKKKHSKTSKAIGFLKREPLLISAFTEVSLNLLARSYLTLLEKDARPDWLELCASAAVYRARFRHRAIILPRLGEDIYQEGISALKALIAGESHPALFVGEAVTDQQKKPVFLCSGMGPQWWGMAHYLLKEAPLEVRHYGQKISDIFQSHAGWSLIDALLEQEETSKVQDTIIAQPGLFLVQLCLARFFALHGITPAAVVGHSLGEVAAAHIAGALSLEDAILVVYHRSRLQARLEGRGSMLAVGLSADIAKEKIAAYEPLIDIAAINAPSSCTLAGDRGALEKIAAQCKEEGVFNRFLQTIVPYHSPGMDEIAEEMVASLSSLTPVAPTLPLYSTVTGQKWEADAFHDGAYWQQNARQPVLFADSIRALLEDEHIIFLELSAHPVLGSSIREIAEETRHSVEICPTLRRKDDDEKSLSFSLTRLALSGAEPDWGHIFTPARIALPHYAWPVIEGDSLQETEAGKRDRRDCLVHPILGTPSLEVGKVWKGDVATIVMPWLPDHRIDGITLFPAAGYIEAALAAHYQIEAKEAAVLEDLRLMAPLVLQEGTVPSVCWSYDEESRVLSFNSETLAWNGDWQTHGQVTILHASPWIYGQVQSAQLKENYQYFSGDNVYQELEKLGLNYGPAFRTLRALYRGKNGAVGEVALHEKESEELKEYFIHPALLDGALHAMIGAFPLEEMAQESASPGIFVPVSLKRLSYLGQKTDKVTVQVTPTYCSLQKVEADLRLYTPEGTLMAEILGLTCRRLARAGQDEASRVRRLLYTPSWVSTERHMLMSEPHKLGIITPKNALFERITPLLEDNGIELEIYQDAEEAVLKAFLENDRQLNALRTLVVFCPFSQKQEKTSIEGVGFVQYLLKIINLLPTKTRKKRIPLLVVTRGAYGIKGQEEVVSADQRALIGFCRAIQSERMDVHLRCLDIPHSVSDDMLEDIAAEFLLEDSADDTVVLRQGQRMVQRLISPTLEPEPEPIAYEQLTENEEGLIGVRLTAGTSHTLEGLHWQAYQVPKPKVGEITLKTLVASLNFKDMLKVMNLLPESVIEGTYNGDAIGMESVSEVVAIGEGVEGYSIGERLVILHPDSFASYRVLPVKKLEYVTRSVTPEIAVYSNEHLAGAPLVFVTAYYCLIRLANVQAGETVLIHAGAGGVGLAAIQIALMRGATVYATAGSQEKRDYLLEKGCKAVWDSRSLEFVEGIRQETQGRGVDVVLNSLPGEALKHSLELVASRGRFVEIGKRDIVEHHRLDLTPFNKNIAFFAFDMDRLMPYDWIYDMFDEILELAYDDKLEFLPYTSFKLSDAGEAFRYLAASKHIGKIVLDFNNMSELQARPPKKKIAEICSDGAYLITGGFGGLGLKLAEILLRQGAGCVHLLGRRLPSTSEKQAEIERLAEIAATLGAEIETHRVDVTDKEALSELISSLVKEGGEGKTILRGVFHTAGILEDAVLPHMTDDMIARVMAPKILGAEALDVACDGLDLDYFVLFSSFTTEIGNIGQSAYLAANAWLDGFAERRRQRGLTGLSIGWGAIGDVGMLSGNETAERMFEAAGVKTLQSEKALSLLPVLMKVDQPNISVVDIDWAKAFVTLGQLAEQTRFSMVKQEARKDGLSETLQALFEIPETERLTYVLTRLKRQLGSVLQIEPETISDNVRLSELGIDSLAGVELQMAIRAEFGVDVSLVILARNETIIEMSRSLLRQAMNMQGGQTSLQMTDGQA